MRGLFQADIEKLGLDPAATAGCIVSLGPHRPVIYLLRRLECVSAARKKAGIALDAREKKQIADALSWKNPAEGELRDFENIALNPNAAVNAQNEAYFVKEVQPHASTRSAAK